MTAHPVYSRLLPTARVLLSSLLLLAALAAGSPSSALALKPAERKAATVKTIDGASLATSAFVEITFKGQFEELFGTKGLRKGSVKVQFVPASGKRTTITETGPAGESETSRRGTKGFSETVRAGRTFSVLVRGLKAPAGKLVVTTRRGKKKLDRQKTRLRKPLTETELDQELDHTDVLVGEAVDTQADALYARSTRLDRIAALKKDLKKATTRAEKRKLRKKLAKQKAKAAALLHVANAQDAKAEVIQAWIKLLDKAIKGPAARACNDGVDNADPEDSLADYGIDPGCVMKLDADETDVGMPLTCPSPGNRATAVGTVAIPTGLKLDSFYVSLPPVAPGEPRDGLIDAPVTASSGGPYPVTWYKQLPCGAEIDMSYSYAVGSYGLRVAISAQSASTTQNPGGRRLSLRLAAGTSR
jgi:hypothetical protein